LQTTTSPSNPKAARTDAELGAALKYHLLMVKQTIDEIDRRGYNCTYFSNWDDHGFFSPKDILDGTDISCSKSHIEYLPGLDKGKNDHVLFGKAK
jgi:hypothetical protein